jgi:hypothetical protein
MHAEKKIEKLEAEMAYQMDELDIEFDKLADEEYTYPYVDFDNSKFSDDPDVVTELLDYETEQNEAYKASYPALQCNCGAGGPSA